MLRLIHSQTVSGPLLIDDIDDGLPNKQTQRLQGDAAAYKRDGYANAPKQACYIPRANPSDATQPGYIDLLETGRVVLSADRGKIAGFQAAGLLEVVSFVASDIDQPAITAADLDDPAAGDLTITGTGFTSLDPDVTTVTFAGDGVGDVTLTVAQIEAVSPGAVTDTEIIIDSTLIADLAPGDTVTVRADSQDSNTFVIAPIITGAEIDVPDAGDLTIDGLGLEGADSTSVRLFGAGVGDITLTAAQIEAVAPGAVAPAEIVIDATLMPDLVAGDEVEVTVDGVVSNAFTITT